MVNLLLIFFFPTVQSVDTTQMLLYAHLFFFYFGTFPLDNTFVCGPFVQFKMVPSKQMNMRTFIACDKKVSQCALCVFGVSPKMVKAQLSPVTPFVCCVSTNLFPWIFIYFVFFRKRARWFICVLVCRILFTYDCAWSKLDS